MHGLLRQRPAPLASMSTPHRRPARRLPERQPYGAQSYGNTAESDSQSARMISGPSRVRPTERHAQARGNARGGIVQDVARGSIGLDYGPYSARINQPTVVASLLVSTVRSQSQSRQTCWRWCSRAETHFGGAAAHGTHENCQHRVGEKSRPRR